MNRKQQNDTPCSTHTHTLYSFRHSIYLITATALIWDYNYSHQCFCREICLFLEFWLFLFYKIKLFSVQNMKKKKNIQTVWSLSKKKNTTTYFPGEELWGHTRVLAICCTAMRHIFLFVVKFISPFIIFLSSSPHHHATLHNIRGGFLRLHSKDLVSWLLLDTYSLNLCTQCIANYCLIHSFLLWRNFDWLVAFGYDCCRLCFVWKDRTKKKF